MGFRKEVFDRCIDSSKNMRAENTDDPLNTVTMDMIDRICELMLFDEKLDALTEQARELQIKIATENKERDQLELLALAMQSVQEGFFMECNLSRLASGDMSDDVIADMLQGLFGEG